MQKNKMECSPFSAEKQPPTYFFGGTVSSVFSPNMFKKQHGMLAFLYTAPAVFLPKIAKNKTKCSPFSSKKIVFDLFVCTVSSLFFPNMFKNETECPPFLHEKCRFSGCVVGFLPKNVDRTGRNARLVYVKNVNV